MDEFLVKEAVVVGGGSPLCTELLFAVGAIGSEPRGKASRFLTNVSSVRVVAFASGRIDCGPVSGEVMTYYPNDVEASLNRQYP